MKKSGNYTQIFSKGSINLHENQTYEQNSKSVRALSFSPSLRFSFSTLFLYNTDNTYFKTGNFLKEKSARIAKI